MAFPLSPKCLPLLYFTALLQGPGDLPEPEPPPCWLEVIGRRKPVWDSNRDRELFGYLHEVIIIHGTYGSTGLMTGAGREGFLGGGTFPTLTMN